ncbi:hypothetical protein BD626DRAFT_355635, partial [Schizophyllum amplum]
LAFLGLGNIVEQDIPRRTTLSDMILRRFNEKYHTMVDDIRNSTGRVSFTADIWSRSGNLQPYMAVTAHYMTRDSS